MTAESDRIFEEYNRQAELTGIPNRVDPTLAFRAPELREALEIWRRAAKGRVIPCRVDMTPKVMKGFLRHLLIIDVVPAAGQPRFRIRISGTEVERMLKNLPKGFLDENLPEPFLSRWQAVLNLALHTRTAVRVSGRVEFRDRTYLNAEVFVGAMGLYAEAPSAILVAVRFESNAATVAPEFGRTLLDIAAQ